MKFVFWQNMVSPHHSYFLRELSKSHVVILIVDTIIENDRVSQGWSIPDMGNVSIIEIGESNKINNILNNIEQYHHIFSGILSYPGISKFFHQIIKKQKVSIISESAIQIGLLKWIRFFKYVYLSYLYNNKIDKIFAMGDLGVNWFRKTQFSKEKIKYFQYTIELPKLNRSNSSYSINDNEIFHLTFMGQLISRKGIDKLIIALSKVKYTNWKLNIIGDGVLRDKIIDIIKKNRLENNVFLHGIMHHNEAIDFLKNHSDYLILPSRFDGWGAVINEALACGIKVITNDKCGASYMIKNESWGYVYKENDESSLVNLFERLFSSNNGNTINESELLSKMYKIENQDKVVTDFISYFKVI